MSKTKLVKLDQIDAETDGRRRRGLKSRAQVLDQALRVASTRGLAGLTIGSLASDLGISKGNITILFNDKETLQLRTIDAGVDFFVSRVVRPATTAPTPYKQLQKLCGLWFDYVETRALPGGCIMTAISSEYRAQPGVLQDRIVHHRTAWHSLITKTIRAARDSGEIDARVDIDQLAFELISYQAAANTAAFIGDKKLFLRAKRTTFARISEARTARRPGSRPRAPKSDFDHG